MSSEMDRFEQDLTLSIKPIGYARTSMKTKFDAPHQPSIGKGASSNFIELIPGMDFENALKYLETFDKIWLIWWFHKNDTWKPMVLPPRGPAMKRGLFATRSPHRPNPIGITCTSLHSIKGLKLEVGELDLMNGTPILDIKPYIPEIDAFPLASSGWIEEINVYMRKAPSYLIKFSEIAKEKLEWLKKEWDEDFISRAVEILERDPTPHKTRRIKKIKKDASDASNTSDTSKTTEASNTTEEENEYCIACGPWRLHFTIIEEQTILIINVHSGYPIQLLKEPGYETIISRDALLSFMEKYS